MIPQEFLNVWQYMMLLFCQVLVTYHLNSWPSYDIVIDLRAYSELKKNCF